MVVVTDIKVFILSTSVTTLMSCVLMVDDTVDGKVGDIMMYHFS